MCPAPTTSDSSHSTGEDSPAHIFAFGEASGDSTLTYSILSLPSEGQVWNTGDGTFAFDPNGDFEDLAEGETRNVTFTYQVTDENGASSQATATITIVGANDGPVAANVAYDIGEDDPAQVFAFNGTDIDNGATLTFGIISQPNAGVVVNNGNGTFSFDPNGDFEDLAEGESQTVSFSYYVLDEHGAINMATATMTILGADEGLVAQDVAYDINEDDPVQAFAFQASAGTGALTYTILTQPAEGAVWNTNTGLFAFSPSGDFEDLAEGETRSVSFTYSVTDENGDSSEATATLTIVGENDGPVASDVAYSIDEDSAAQVFAFDGTDIDNGAVLTYGIMTQPAAGTVVNNGDGTFAFDPAGAFESLAEGETQTVSFSYYVLDEHNAISQATATITVIGADEGPVAQDVTYDIQEDDSVQAFAFQASAGTGALTYAILTQPAEGTVWNTNTGLFAFSPSGDFEDLAEGDTRSVSFTYSVTDENGDSSEATATITVLGENDAPVASDVTYSIDEDSAAQVFAFNGTDVDSGAVLTYGIMTQPAEGTVINNGDGTFSFDPAGAFDSLAEGETSTVSFSYYVLDEHNAISQATATITIVGTNHAPVATDVSYSIGEDAPAQTFAFDGYDQDAGTVLTFAVVTPPSEGTLVNNGDGTFAFAPAGDFEDLAEGETRVVSFTYSVTDEQGASSQATATITVVGANDGPVATNVTHDVSEDGPAQSFAFPATDVDNGAVLTYEILTQPVDGTLVNNGDGTFSYNPDGAFETLAVGETVSRSFTYEVTDDHGQTSQGTVTLTIVGANDAPIVVDDAQVAVKNTSRTILAEDLLANDSDIDGDTLTIASVTSVSGGTVTLDGAGNVLFVPDTGFSGTATFTYTVSDGHGGTGTALVSVEVVDVDSNSDPIAVDDYLFGTGGDDTLNGGDGDDTLIGGSGHDTINGGGGDDTIFTGGGDNSDTIDGGEGTDTVIVTGDDPVTIDMGDTNVEVVIGGGGDDTVDTSTQTDPTTVEGGGGDDTIIVGGGGDTTVSGGDGTDTIVFNDGDTPASDYDYTYDDEDGGWTITGPDGSTTTVTDVEVIEFPDMTVELGPDGRPTAFVIWEDIPATIPKELLLANDSDPDGDTLTIVSVGNGPDSTVTLDENGDITFLGAQDFNGVTTFTYTITDGNGGYDSATVTVRVTPVNDDPVIESIEGGTGDEDTVITGTVVATDVDGDDLTYTVPEAHKPAHGTVVFADDGTYAYTPDENFGGTDSFTVEVSDGHGGVVSQEITVTVAPVNDAPIIGRDTLLTTLDTPVTTTIDDLLANDSDPEGDPLTFDGVGNAQGGTVTLDEEGTITFTPNEAFVGLGSFEYTVSDGQGGVTTGVVTVSIPPKGSTSLVSSDEVSVNTTKENNQDRARVAVLADGSYVVTWFSPSSAGTMVYGQRYGVNGTPIGDEFTVNEIPFSDGNVHDGASDNRRDGTVTALADGGFLVTWVNGNNYIHARRYDAQGIPLNGEMTLAQGILPEVSALEDGGYILAIQGGDSSYSASFGQRFDANDQPVGGRFQFNVAESGAQSYPDITVLADGSVVALWHGDGQGPVMRLFNADGQALTDEILVTTNNGHLASTVSSLSGGGFIVTWPSTTDGNGYGIQAIQYDASGEAVGDAFQVNEYTMSHQNDPEVIGTVDGGFVIAWQSNGQDGSGYGIYARRYGADGTPLGAEFQINTTTLGNQVDVTLAARPDGGFVASWTSANSDGEGNGTGIVSKVFSASTQPPVIIANDVVVTEANPLDAQALVTGSHVQGDGSVRGGLQQLIQYEFVDDTHGAGSGHFLLDGVEVAAGNVITLDANELSRLTFVGGTDLGADSFRVRATDGLSWSDWATGSAQTLPLTSSLVSSDEVAVNTTTENSQDRARVAVLADGSYVVTWFSPSSAGTMVYGQRYGVNGTPIGDEFTVNEIPFTDGNVHDGASDNRRDGTVTALSGGGFLVTWVSGDNYTRGRRYDAQGVPLSGEMTLAQGILTEVSALEDGGYILAIQGGDSSYSASFGQRFDANDQPVGERFQFNIAESGAQSYPDITVLADGSMVALWHGDGQGPVMRLYDADGHALTDEILVTTNNGHFASTISSLSGGGFIVTWPSTTDGSSYGIQAMQYDASGEAVGAAFQVNEYTYSNQNDPEVIGTADGGYVIAWQSDAQDGSGYGIYARRYGADGTPLGAEFQINTTTLGNQVDVTLAARPDGGFVASWTSENIDGSGTAVVSKVFSGSIQPPVIIANDVVVTEANPLDAQALVTGSHVQGDGSVRGGLQHLTQYEFVDDTDGAGSGHFLLDGEEVAAGTIITLDANELSRLTFVGGTDLGADSFRVRATDGLSWSDWATGSAQTLPFTSSLVSSDEVSVNTTKENNQDRARVAVLADGSYVVTWFSPSQAGTMVYGQRFGADSTPIGDEFTVNEMPFTDGGVHDGKSDNRRDGTVTALAEGGFLVTWVSGDNYTHARRYDAQGVPLSGEMTLAQGVLTEVSALEDGGYILAIQGGDSSYSASFGQRFDANDRPVGERFQFNIAEEGAQSYPDITVLADGSMVALWHGDRQGPVMRLYDAVGHAITPEIVLPANKEHFASTVSSLSGGGFIVTWPSTTDGNSYGIQAMQYDASGEAVGDVFQVNEYTISDQNDPEVIGTADGGYVIAWQSNGQDGNGYGIYARRYSADGTPLGAEFQINTTTLGNQVDVTLAARPDGGFVASWTSANSDGEDNGTGIVSRVFSASTQPPVIVANDVVVTEANPLDAQDLVTGSHVQGDGSVRGGLQQLTQYEFVDLTEGAGSGHFLLDGVEVAAGTVITLDADELSRLTFVGGTDLGADSFRVRATDGLSWSDWATGSAQTLPLTSSLVSSDEVAVNTTKENSQDRARVAVLADGSHVVTWFSPSSAGTMVYGQRFGADSTPIGEEFTVNEIPFTDGGVHDGASDNRRDGTVTALADGGFLVTWVSGDNYTHARRYDAQGVPLSGEMTLAQGVLTEVSALEDGGYILAIQGGDSSYSGSFGQRFDANDRPVGERFQFNTAESGAQSYPDITVLADGSVVALWHDDTQGPVMRLYDADGHAITPEIVLPANREHIASTVSSLSGGGFIVTWPWSTDGNGYGIQAMQYDASGEAVGDAFQVNEYTMSHQNDPEVIGTADGGYVIAWQSNGQDGSGYGIYARRYGADGTPLGAEFQINTTTLGNQVDVTLAARPDGGFVASWTSENIDGSGTAVVSKVFSGSIQPPVIIANDVVVTEANPLDAQDLVTGSHVQGDGSVRGGLQQLTQYEFVDDTDGVGSGHFLLDGEEVAAGTVITLDADELSRLTFVGGTDLGADSFRVRATDGLSWSDWATGSAQTLPLTSSLVSSDEVSVNTTKENNQDRARVAVLADGSHVVTWFSPSSAGTMVYGQRFGADSTPIGDEFTVNEMPFTDGNVHDGKSDNRRDGTITALADGGFLVTWVSSDNYTRGRRYDAQGVPLSGEMTLAQGILTEVSALEDGGYILAIQGGDSSYSGSFGQRFDANDRPVGERFQFNTAESGAQSYPDITVLADGSMVALWHDDTQGPVMRLYDADGHAITPEIVLPANREHIASTVSSLSGGGFIVTWPSTTDGNGYGIQAMQYDASGEAVGDAFQVNEYTVSHQNDPEVIGTADGGYVIAWQSNGQDGNGYGIYARRYGADGTPLGAEFQINTTTLGNQVDVTLAARPDGGFVASWTSENTDGEGNGTGIVSRVFSASTQPPVIVANDVLITEANSLDAQALVTGSHVQGDGSVRGGLQHLTQYEFVDDTDGASSGHFLLDGVEVAAGTVITLDADELSRLTFVGGTDLGADSFRVRATDGLSWSDWATGSAQTLSLTSSLVSSEEVAVNTTTENSQDRARVAVLADGSHVVTWFSPSSVGTMVYGQRFGADSTPIGDEFTVNEMPFTDGGVHDGASDNRRDGTVTALSGGGFLVTWVSGDNYTRGRRYDAQGVPLSGEMTLAQGVLTEVSALEDGGYILAIQGGDSSYSASFGQRFDANDRPVGERFQFNIAESGAQSYPDITVLADGSLVALWHGDGQGPVMRLFKADGEALTQEILVTTNNGHLASTVSSLSGGGFIVTWPSTTDGNGYGIQAMQYDASGEAVGAAFQVNEYTMSHQNDPEVIGTADGGFVIAWQSNGQDGSGYGIYARRYGADGMPLGAEFQINTTTLGNQVDVTLAARPDGGFVASWTSENIDGSGTAVVSKVFSDATDSTGGSAIMDGDNTLYGSSGSDILTGGNGADTYLVGGGTGADVIDNIGHGADGDKALFGNGIAADQVWLSQSGNDLTLSVIGTGDSVTVKDWYTSADNQVSAFQTADGAILSAANVDSLVQAMAAFAPPGVGQTDLTTDQHQALDTVIASSWQIS
ncbi:tandem-95 repeat protein [Rhodospirillum sp. A1_3_36]|uniref:tandem-95 repeat protein n=1 Tax=Rhodospirillum sp. A1_3_36 TaxID=3391666 RepID=UPI0039A5B09A